MSELLCWQPDLECWFLDVYLESGATSDLFTPTCYVIDCVLFSNITVFFVLFWCGKLHLFVCVVGATNSADVFCLLRQVCFPGVCVYMTGDTYQFPSVCPCPDVHIYIYYMDMYVYV